MKKYKVKVDINGKKYDYIVKSPVELTSTEAKKQAKQELSEPQRFQSFLQGATLGFSDEAGAAFSDNYTQDRDNTRAKLAQYSADSPIASTMYEIAGAVPATALSLFGTPASTAVAGTRLAQLTSKVLPLATESAIAAYGTSESDDLLGQAKDVALGTLSGTVLGGAASGLIKGAGALGNNFMSFVREKLGDKAQNAVQAELRRLVELTGKNTDEVIQDVVEGRLMAENKTLTLALKNYVNEGGKAGKEVLDKTKDLASRRRSEGQQSLEQGLVGGQSGNQLARAQRTDDALKLAERDAYSSAFDRSGEPSGNLVNNMLNIIQRFPKAGDDLADLYTSRNLVPLFSKDASGATVMVRQPTAEDAEILYRGIRDYTQQMYTTGKGSLGTEAKQATQALKSDIDAEFPSIGRARAVSSGRKSASEALNLGRSALSKDPEELEMLIERMSESEVKAYRQGVMNALNKKLGTTKTTFANLADEDKNLGKILRMSLPQDMIDSVVNRASRAGEMTEISSKMPMTAGSPTQGLQKEAKASGTGQNIGGLLDALSGSPYAGIQLVSGLFEKTAQDLTPEQRTQVVNILFSEDANLVYKALTDNTALAQLEKKIKSIADTIGKSAVRASQFQAVQASQE